MNYRSISYKTKNISNKKRLRTSTTIIYSIVITVLILVSFSRQASASTFNSVQSSAVNITGDFNYNYLSSEPSNDKQMLYIYDGILNCANSNTTQSSNGKVLIELQYSK